MFNQYALRPNVPVKCARQDQVVVDGELVETPVEVALIDEPTGSIDDDESEDDPADPQSVALCEMVRIAHTCSQPHTPSQLYSIVACCLWKLHDLGTDVCLGLVDVDSTLRRAASQVK